MPGSKTGASKKPVSKKTGAKTASKKPASKKPVSKKTATAKPKKQESPQKSGGDKVIEFISSILTSTEDKFLNFVDDVITKQELTKKKAETFTKKMKDFRDSSFSKVSSLVNDSVKNAIKNIDITHTSDIKELKSRIKEIEKKINSKKH